MEFALKRYKALLLCMLFVTVSDDCAPAQESRFAKSRSLSLTPLQLRLSQDPRNLALRKGWEPDRFFSNDDIISAADFILRGDIVKLQEAIDAGLAVNVVGKHNMTLLYWALVCDKLPAFCLLLDHGANPDVALNPAIDVGMDGIFYEGDTVLLSAARRGRVSFLLKGIPYSKEIEKRGAGNDSLMNVVVDECPSHDVLRSLIETGAEINSMDRIGASAVVRLTVSQKYEAARILLEAGADPRLGKGGIESFWQAFDYQQSLKIPETDRRELDHLKQTVMQRLADDP